MGACEFYRGSVYRGFIFLVLGCILGPLAIRRILEVPTYLFLLGVHGKIGLDLW